METFGPDPTCPEDEPEPLDTYLLTVDTLEYRYVLLLEAPNGERRFPTWRRGGLSAVLTMATILQDDLWVSPLWLPDNAEVAVIGGSERGGWVVQVALQVDELPKFETDVRLGVWMPWAEFVSYYGQTLGLVD